MDVFKDIYLNYDDYLGPTDGTLSCVSLSRSYQTLSERTKSARKRCKRRFGGYAPFDYSLKSVVEGGLPVMLQSGTPLMYFVRYLLDEWATESLFFLDCLEQYFLNESNDRKQRQKLFDAMQSLFIEQNSLLQVHFPCNGKDTEEATLQSAQRQCLANLHDKFVEFKQDAWWERMLSEIGNMYTPYYPIRIRHQAIEHVLQFLEQHGTQRNDINDDGASDGATILQICHLAKKFVERKMGVKLAALELLPLPPRIQRTNGGDGLYGIL